MLNDGLIEVSCNPAMGEHDIYNLSSLKLPKLTGNTLRIAAAAVGFGPTRALLMGRLLRDGGIDRARNWHLDEPPTLYPTPRDVHADKAEHSEEKGATSNPEQSNPEQPNPEHLQSTGAFVDAATIAAAYRDGRTDPVAIAERVLNSIETSRAATKPIAAFISVLREDVLKQAAASQARFAKGACLGPLDGIPIAIKDEIDQTPHSTTVGTAFLGNHAVTTDATVVARLRAAGAILIGKTNMHEIGINPTGLNIHYGIARNPYDLDHDTGGSSSGSAAAVAAGICPVAIGADGGGSIRIPAALCGLVGLKATFGRISEHGAAPLTWSMGHLGPIGVSVADCAAVYNAIAGPDPFDAHTLDQPRHQVENWRSESLSGIRLGVFRPWFDHATDDIVAANRAMLDKLCTRGATVVDIEIPELDQMRVAHAITILTEMATAMENYRCQLKKLGAGVRINLTIGRYLRGTDYLVCQRMRTRALEIFAQIYNQVDCIITPATAIVAPRIPSKALPHGWSHLSEVTELMRYVIPGNFVGLPAISFPVGYSATGLPISMQAMSKHWNEKLLFRIAAAAETALERITPPNYMTLLPEG